MTWPVVTFNERLSSWVCTFIESKVALFRILELRNQHFVYRNELLDLHQIERGRFTTQSSESPKHHVETPFMGTIYKTTFNKNAVGVEVDARFLGWSVSTTEVKTKGPLPGFGSQISEPVTFRETTSLPGSFLSREKDPGWVWSRATQILGGNK